MGPRSRLFATALLTAVVAVGCSGDDSGDAPAAPTSSAASTVASTAGSTAASTPEPSGPPTPATGSLFPVGDVDAGLQPWVELATTDLATRLGIEPGAVEPVSAVLVTWPDVSLGCPEPDRQYATIVTDGAVIELAVDGEIYRYHAGGSETPFLCPTPITEAPSRL